MLSKCRWLILVPTELELAKLKLTLGEQDVVERCGFGPVVSAATAARCIALHEPQSVMLCGISGSLNSDTEPGAAFQFRKVAMYGIGVGEGDNYHSAEQMGWRQWQSGEMEIGTELSLATVPDFGNSTRDLVVSCCAASADNTEAGTKQSIFPSASAEEMEGFSVATAARLASIPCHIVRGISNRAGDRNHQVWMIDEALESVSQLVNQILGQDLQR